MKKTQIMKKIQLIAILTFTVAILFSCGKKTEVKDVFHPGTDVLSEQYEYYLDDDGNEIKEGSYTMHDNKGEVVSEGQYKDGLKTGKWVKYHENGNIRSTAEFVRDSIDGTYEAFYQTGHKKSIIKYEIGKRQGLYQSFFKNGQLQSEVTYVDGKREGFQKKWNEDGILISEKEYNNGVPHGLFKEYYVSGGVKQEGYFKLSKADSTWHSYNEKGEITGTTRYQQ